MELTLHRVWLDDAQPVVDAGIVDGRIAVIQEDELAPGRSALRGQNAMLSSAFIDPTFTSKMPSCTRFPIRAARSARRSGFTPASSGT